MAAEYNVQAIVDDLRKIGDLDPNQHDGSYELMKETIQAYSEMSDYSPLDYRDLNLVYLTTVGTWKQSISSKKKTIDDSHLSSEAKQRLKALWDTTWKKAEMGEYTNNEPDASGHRSIGMFGTGFFSFQNKTTAEHAQAFIRMCVDILPMTDDGDMFDRAELVLKSSFQGMRAASASMVLHCLKPMTFPIMNSNMGNKNIFEVLGVNLVRKENIDTYIENCRRIKSFRDQNFAIRNYRVFDQAAWKVNEYAVNSVSGETSKVWLVTWNKDNWNWDGFAERCESTKAGQTFIESWACASKSPRIGDEVFMLKLGDMPRGIIGHGVVTREPYEKEHYDASKAAAGKTEKAIDIRFDRLIDYNHDQYIPQDELIGKCAAQHWSPQNSGIEIKPEVLPTLRLLWNAVTSVQTVYGFDRIVSFLSDYKGQHYIAPEKAGDQAEYMGEMRRRGQEARQKFIAFAQETVGRIPDLEYVACSNWINQGQTVEEYLWIELKNPEWKDYPQSVSLSVTEHNQSNPGDGYCLTIRTEIRDVNSKKADYERQYRLLDCDLLDGMSYMASYKDGSYHFLGTDQENAKALCDNGTVLKLEIIERIDELAKKDTAGTIFAEVLKAVKEIQPLYEYVLAETDWWPSLTEYDPGFTVQEYHDLLLNERVVKRSWLNALFELYRMPDHQGTCKQLGDRYGYAPSHYISYLSTAASNIAKETGCSLPKHDDNAKYWPILFRGKYVQDKSQGSYCWKMRKRVINAIEMLIDEGVIDERALPEEERDTMVQYDHNLILYGPPGTGKTYNSVIYAVAICEGKPVADLRREPYSDVLRRYRELKEAGRIAFTTFHQSYGYEEFIEGIKPALDSESGSLSYTMEDGIFKSFCLRAKTVKVHGSRIKEQPRIWGMILGGTGMTALKKQCFENNEIRLGWSEVDDVDVEGEFVGDEKSSWNGKHMVFDFKYSMEVGDIVVIEKSNKSIDAIGVITGEYEYDQAQGRYPRKRNVEWLVKDIDQDMAAFLPEGRKQLSRFSLYAFDYIGMDVISRILDEHGKGTAVEIKHEAQPYVFIIDEINRGNISKIFGELITLIEETKRAGAPEAMEATLPYSGEQFSVPENVYILGTMNTADRSIALMDTALRRRFEFEEMMPDAEVLESLGVATIVIDDAELNVARMLDVINARIEYLFDREHTIGHAFFTRLKDDPTLETLAGIFEKNVIPLLQEYFYEDYEKIQLVLGDNAKDDEYKFVLDKPLRIRDMFRGNPDIDLPEKSYSIQREAFRRIESYKQIAEGL